MDHLFGHGHQPLLAVIQLGRLDRNAYLSTYFTDALLRRQVNTQLDRQTNYPWPRSFMTVAC
jgi:hypothetical protein